MLHLRIPLLYIEKIVPIYLSYIFMEKLICYNTLPFVLILYLLMLLRIPNGKRIWFWYETATPADASELRNRKQF